MAYIDGTKVCFDDCDIDTWSALWLEDIIEDLGYEKAGRIDVYWLLPGMQINEDGLRLIVEDKDTLCMVSKVKEGHRFLMLYLDHEPSMNAAHDCDDIVANPVVNLPTVISPMRMPTNVNNIDQILDDHNVQGPSRVISKRATTFDEDWDSDNSSDSDFVLEIIDNDNDNDIEDGDDDLLQEYADQVPKADKKGIAEAKLSEDEFLEAPDSDEETERYNFKAFTGEDMHDPKFHVGQIFQSVDMLRKAIREYSCKQRRNITLPKNDKTRVLAKCQEGCPWYLFTSKDCKTKAIMVKTFNDKHTCQKKWQVRAFTARYIGKHYVDELRANEKMTLKGLVEDTSSWRWFLTALKQDLGIVNTSPWTIMSDKQKGLIKAVKELFQDSSHRFCEHNLQTVAFGQQNTQTYEPEVLSALLDQSASSQREPTEFTPLPESSFIQANVLNQMPVQPTTISREGNVQRKRQVIAMAKLKAAAQRRDIADQDIFDEAMAKLQQEEEKRAQAVAQKKEEALAKKLAAKEKRKAEREAK
ncbi:hypothetical protein ACQ4PT_011866 [Festuca glaucescens]